MIATAAADGSRPHHERGPTPAKPFRRYTIRILRLGLGSAAVGIRVSTQSFDRVSFGEYLVRAGLVHPRELRDALDLQEREGGSLGTNLLAIGAIEETALLRALGAYHTSPTVSGDELQNVPWSVLRAVSLELVRRYSIVPYRIQGNTICVASRRPGSIAIENEIVLATSRLTRTYLALDVRLQEALQGYFGIRADPRALEVARRLAESPKPAAKAAGEPFPLGTYTTPEGGSAAVSRWLTGTPSGPEPVTTREDHPTALSDSAGHGVSWERFEQPRRRRMSDVLATQAPPGSVSIVEDVLWSEVHPSAEPEASEPAASEPAASEAETAELTPPALDRVRERDRVADQLLAGSSAFRRRLVLAHRSRRVLGWKGDGTGIVPRLLAQVSFPVEESPPFLALYNGSEFWLGPLLPSAGTDQLVKVLGGRKPTSCVLLPVRTGDKIAAFLYLDNGSSGVVGARVGELLDLVKKAGQTLERLIQKVRPAV